MLRSAQLLDEAAVDALLEETIQAVDELATHHSIEEIYVDQTIVRSITAHDLTYRASGTLSVGLQWGSNSDVRNSDGAELDQSFPFVCDITVPPDSPWNLARACTNQGVDTRSWFDPPDDDE